MIKLFLKKLEWSKTQIFAKISDQFPSHTDSLLHFTFLLGFRFLQFVRSEPVFLPADVGDGHVRLKEVQESTLAVAEKWVRMCYVSPVDYVLGQWSRFYRDNQ